MRFIPLLAVVLLAAPAAAQNYETAPAVTARRANNGGEAQASMDVRATPAAVWAVLSDCPRARRFMRDLISCRILDQGDGWDVREHRVRGWLLHPVMRNVSRITLEPNRRLAFRRIEGDWTRSDGEWVLTPIDNGQGTHVEYRVIAVLGGPIPAGLTQSRLVSSVRNTLADLRRVVESQNLAQQTSVPVSP